ncbi:MAG: thioredoxin [Candidatus Woesearchaeota archaeon]
MVVKEISENEFEKEALESNMPVIVDFFANWCGPCVMLKPIFKEVSDEFTDKMKFLTINTDNAKNISSKYSIDGIPCLIVFNNGAEVDRIVGYLEKEELIEAINSILNKI